ncbi:hypothetical protein B0A52_03224 [Exophiala mesophila]|uniref:Transcription factor domain-containing protein n=1 Tax=Exophiala mesophila TaxID=212818 RepID=A0A438NAR9_EXOME|nr:hypothetical protein B0A52_03224 [Exophiala mesophila]
MWYGQADGSEDIVMNTIMLELERLFQEYPGYSELDLLAAAQSVLMLLIIICFGEKQQWKGPPAPRQVGLLIQAWDIKHKLAETGLFLPEESSNGMPSWTKWAIVSSKRRTILAMHHVEWSWSVRHGYPILTCFELAPFPAPAAKHLWQAANERKWKKRYAEWLHLWKGGSYKVGEFFHIPVEGNLDDRSERWLAEADEFGMMLMAEGKIRLLSDEFVDHHLT